MGCISFEYACYPSAIRYCSRFWICSRRIPRKKIEVQGHTDNVGVDAYNQTLSEAPAKTILTWLTQHGIAGDRLTANGFGKTRPIADNATDAGRAKNRRVEIADPNCGAHSK